MSGSARSALNRRLAWQQVALFAALLTLIAVANAFSTLADHARLGHPLPPLDPFIWEFSSVLVIGALTPLLAAFNRRVTIDSRSWRWALPAHLAATAPWSIVHVAGMVALRKFVYALAGGQYIFGPVLSGWIYEYRKDFVSYWLILAGLYGFAAYRRWREAQAAMKVDTPVAEAADAAERLVVRRLNREFILGAGEIDHIEASGNYVTVHANGTAYRMRASLASLSRRLDSRRFVQVHRRYIVNIDRVREIQPWDNGDYRIVLKDGDCINFSRRYRARLAHLFNPSADHHHQDAARP